MFTVDQFINNIICYHGPINIDLISFTGKYMKQYISDDAKIIGRVYKVFIELTQNVSYYSAQQHSNAKRFGTGIGWFRIDENKDYYSIRTGNRIFKEHGPILIKNSKEINSLKTDGLRALKRKKRSQSDHGDIGAHIGLIQTGLITGNQIEITIDDIDERHSFFTITAKVNKRLKN
jgi:hypothetical protein